MFFRIVICFCFWPFFFLLFEPTWAFKPVCILYFIHRSSSCSNVCRVFFTFYMFHVVISNYFCSIFNECF
ncbi:unnamed protein product [Meloidogyne enterolobii]|uniref:Uncharacterized protein n=1 Tax=Meloidogyne enterolobii TaxID=390850 RepID=A0ACB0ZT34_MELEN